MFELICGLRTVAKGTIEQIKETVLREDINLNGCTLIDTNGDAWAGTTLYIRENASQPDGVLAADLGISRQRVQAIRAAHGIPPARRRGERTLPAPCPHCGGTGHAPPSA